MISKCVEILRMSKEIFEILNSFEMGSVEFADKYQEMADREDIQYIRSIFNNEWTDYFIEDYDKPTFMGLTKEHVEKFLADAKNVLSIQFTDNEKAQVEFERVFCRGKKVFNHYYFTEDPFIELQRAYYTFKREYDNRDWNKEVIVLNV